MSYLQDVPQYGLHVKPILQALLLAERIYEINPTAQKIIVGTFNQITLSSSHPSRIVEQGDGTKAAFVRGGNAGDPWVYISLTDVNAGTKVSLQFVDIALNEVLFSSESTITKASKLHTIEMVLQLPSLGPFVHGRSGPFSFDVLWDGEILGSHRIFLVDETGRPKGDEGASDE